MPVVAVKRIAVAGLALTLMFAAGVALAAAPTTERVYLSGKGPKDAILWDFTVSGGRRAGEKATIPVPGNWEQHGFGTYSYGETTPRSEEKGLYARRFDAPAEWKGKRVRIVFEAAMTDATVRINGVQAGRTHQGGFYRFSYDITPLLKLGAENTVEVEVSKASADRLTDRAERASDYWVFGGLFRPVWLEVSPMEAIDHVAIDARADGAFTADVRIAADKEATRVEGRIVTRAGEAVGAPFSVAIPGGGAGRVRLATMVANPKLWSAETPNLYEVRLTLFKGDEAIHQTSQRFGFRTFELREGDGLYLNGQRILLKGVNRHSFRPQTARSLNPEDNWDDVRLIKSMNMNAVRMSHYPPDPALLEAADELGLYVLDELSGWQNAHGTEIGRQLVREMVERDVNHPSILFWDNGNEGGFNRELDGEFSLYDPQRRRVLHPWEVHDGIDTKHYSPYADLVRRAAGPYLLMPTEVVHALYDGGGAAGLADYWKVIEDSRFGAGAFLWAYADEGVARTDRGGAVDVFSTYAPDGVVGPNHEKEGSYYALREIWSPLRIAAPDMARFDGRLVVENHYDFTRLDAVRFQWKLLRYPDAGGSARTPTLVASGEAKASATPAHQTGDLLLNLPSTWRSAQALSLTAVGPDGKEIYTWVWPTAAPALPTGQGRAVPIVASTAGGVVLTAGPVSATIDPATGLLTRMRRGGRTIDLANGPRLTFARPAHAAPTWLALDGDAASLTRRLAAPQLASVIEVEMDLARTDAYGGLRLEITGDGVHWTPIYDSTRRSGDGVRYTFAPRLVSAVRIVSPRKALGEPMAIKAFRLGYEADRFPAPAAGPARVTSGVSRDPATGERTAWVEARGAGGLDTARWTLRPDGSLRLDYSYSLSGDYLYHGVTFDQPEDGIRGLRTLAAGPARVWRNRLAGAELGLNDLKPAPDTPETFAFSGLKGYFADLYWARFETDKGAWSAASGTKDIYLRVGTPMLGHGNTSPDFPAGDVSFLHAIPAIGSKFVTPANTGPQSQPATAGGVYSGSLVFSVLP
jgi:hypothetical protein